MSRRRGFGLAWAALSAVELGELGLAARIMDRNRPAYAGGHWLGYGTWVTHVDAVLEARIREARRRSAGSAPLAEFRVGDAYDLPFPPASVDACRAERVLQHLSDPVRAVAEMVRVTKPLGRVVVLEPDWETMVIDHPDHALTRRILDARSATLPSPRVGRQLRRLLSCAGLTGLTVLPLTMVTAGVPDAAGTMLELLRLPEAAGRAAADRLITGAQADRWLTEVTDAAGSGAFFATLTSFLVAGAKPG